MQTRCVVFGGAGFIGRKLCEALHKKEGYLVRVFDQSALGNSLLQELDVEWYEGSFLNQKDIERAMQDCDVIFHLISTTIPESSNANPVFDAESNLLGTLRMLLCAVKHDIKKVIFVSSGGTVYGKAESLPIKESHPTNPLCSYGITKLAIEKYLHLFYVNSGLEYRILRISNAYGKGQELNSKQGAVGVFIGNWLSKKPILIWGDGEVVRDYIHVDDAIMAIVKAAAYKGEYRIFNIGSGVGHTLNDIVRIIEKETQESIEVHYLEGRKLDVPINILDNSLARKELEWEVRLQFHQGLADLVKDHTEIRNGD